MGKWENVSNWVFTSEFRYPSPLQNGMYRWVKPEDIVQGFKFQTFWWVFSELKFADETFGHGRYKNYGNVLLLADHRIIRTVDEKHNIQDEIPQSETYQWLSDKVYFDSDKSIENYLREQGFIQQHNGIYRSGFVELNIKELSIKHSMSKQKSALGGNIIDWIKNFKRM